MARLASGRIVVWDGGALWILQVPTLEGAKKRTDFHAHHAIQITLALDGRYDLHFETTPSLPGPAVMVSADVSHAFEPKGLIGLLFIDPDTAAGRALLDGPLAGRDATELTPAEATPLQDAIRALHARPEATDADWRETGQALTRAFVGAAEPPPADARIAQTLEWASANLDEPLGIAEAADRVGLSEGRMSHLFVEQTGLPFRTYVLWLRIRKALDAYAQGASLTTAAYDAGFADSAHFSRTFRRMFGVAAAELQLA